jgi:hypothetical protein
MAMVVAHSLQVVCLSLDSTVLSSFICKPLCWIKYYKCAVKVWYVNLCSAGGEVSARERSSLNAPRHPQQEVAAKYSMLKQASLTCQDVRTSGYSLVLDLRCFPSFAWPYEPEATF